MHLPEIYKAREQYSKDRLSELRNRLAQLPGIADFPNFAIFGAGSYGRYEASLHSDIDLFFLCKGDEKQLIDPRTKTLRLFGSLIDTIHTMNFPKLSNDCEYLKIIHTLDMAN